MNNNLLVRLVATRSELVHESYTSLEVAFLKAGVHQIALVYRQLSLYRHRIRSILRGCCVGGLWAMARTLSDVGGCGGLCEETRRLEGARGAGAV